jgi:hypothetical protein
MKSLFNQKDAGEFIARINQLTPASQPLWGKMNVAQMLAHCEVPLRVAHGELKPKVSPLIRFLFGGMAKKSLLSGKPFKKNSPTMSEAKIADDRIFETEKQKLIQRINEFPKRGANGITKEDHPFFGKLSVADWDLLQVKHLDHHLSQFGV